MANPAAPPDQAPLAQAPAPTPAPAPRKDLAGTALGSFTARVLLVCAGAGFVVGFFLPWFNLGGAAFSGLNLLVLQGQVVEFVTAPQRILMFSVPMFGAALAVTGFIGHRIALWLALGAAVVVVGGGMYTLVKLFFGATGMGMWIVVGSALMALAVALLTLGRSIRR